MALVIGATAGALGLLGLATYGFARSHADAQKAAAVVAPDLETALRLSLTDAVRQGKYIDLLGEQAYFFMLSSDDGPGYWAKMQPAPPGAPASFIYFGVDTATEDLMAKTYVNFCRDLNTAANKVVVDLAPPLPKIVVTP